MSEPSPVVAPTPPVNLMSFRNLVPLPRVLLSAERRTAVLPAISLAALAWSPVPVLLTAIESLLRSASLIARLLLATVIIVHGTPTPHDAAIHSYSDPFSTFSTCQERCVVTVPGLLAGSLFSPQGLRSLGFWFKNRGGFLGTTAVLLASLLGFLRKVLQTKSCSAPPRIRGFRCWHLVRLHHEPPVLLLQRCELLFQAGPTLSTSPNVPHRLTQKAGRRRFRLLCFLLRWPLGPRHGFGFFFPVRPLALSGFMLLVRPPLYSLWPWFCSVSRLPTVSTNRRNGPLLHIPRILCRCVASMPLCGSRWSSFCGWRTLGRWRGSFGWRRGIPIHLGCRPWRRWSVLHGRRRQSPLRGFLSMWT
mmetsp:Transcript_16459/g.44604  ORF Transcript_16459/g.44604 Transcript_16459/m.44604 type:complete len:361 (+) Transcript_16459:512-1594(+)